MRGIPNKNRQIKELITGIRFCFNFFYEKDTRLKELIESLDADRVYNNETAVRILEQIRLGGYDLEVTGIYEYAFKLF